MPSRQNFPSPLRRAFGAVALVSLFVAVVVTAVTTSSSADDTDAQSCPTADGTLSPEEVDGASATECKLVGELVVSDAGALEVPAPGYGGIAASRSDVSAFTCNVVGDGSLVGQDDLYVDGGPSFGFATPQEAMEALKTPGTDASVTEEDEHEATGYLTNEQGVAVAQAHLSLLKGKWVADSVLRCG